MMMHTQFKDESQKKKKKVISWSWSLYLLRTATSLAAWWLDWTLRDHILSNQWFQNVDIPQNQMGSLLQTDFWFTHRMSRPRWHHWRILPNIKGENNTNSFQILSENWKGRLSSNSFYKLPDTKIKDIMRKLQTNIPHKHRYPVTTSVQHYTRGSSQCSMGRERKGI